MGGIINKSFPAQDPFKGLSYTYLILGVFLFIFVLLVILIALVPRMLERIAEISSSVAVLFVLLLIGLLLFIYSKVSMKKLEYVITENGITFNNKPFLSPFPSIISFQNIIGVEYLEREGMGPFTLLRQKLLLKGQILRSLASTEVLQNVVLVHTNYLSLRGKGGISFALSPQNAPEFAKLLKNKLKLK